jgi:Tol biopolymer transport system component
MIGEGLMAGISGSPDVTIASDDAERGGQTVDGPTPRFAWLAVGFAAWIVGAFFFLLWGFFNAQVPDLLRSIYAVPFYLGILVLSGVSAALAIRASRQGRSWRRPFPAGYGVLGAGSIALLVGLVADAGWRGGVGDPQGIAGLLAPTRLLLVVGLALVAVGPLRSALRSRGVAVPRWPAVLSASLLLAVLWLPGGFAPVIHPWMEHARALANAEIWLMDSDGAHQTRLIEAHDDVMAWNAVWSPDGKQLAYTRMVFGDRPPVDVPDQADVWIASADGSDAHPLVERPDWQWLPHWSPDGAWVAYTDEPEAGPWADAGPAGLGGGGILGTGFGFGSSNPVRTHADIWRVRSDGSGQPERLTDDPGDDRAATFSPDGTKLAFDSTRAEGTDIWMMGADGSDPRQLTFDHGYTWGATWSPDGSRIAYNAWRPDNQGIFNQSIYLIDPDGSDDTRLTFGEGQDSGPSWSPDGQRIAFHRQLGDADGGEIWSINVDGSDELQLSRDPGAGDELTSGGGAWSPDGRIAFLRGENPPASAHPLAREDLATAAMLITAVLVAFIAALLANTNPPFGAFAVLIGGPTALFSTAAYDPNFRADADQLRFLPAAIMGGLLVDILVRFSPDRWRIVVAAAGSAAAFVVGVEVTIAVTFGLGWSASLLTGVALTVAAAGWGIAEVLRRPRGGTTEVGP